MLMLAVSTPCMQGVDPIAQCKREGVRSDIFNDFPEAPGRLKKTARWHIRAGARAVLPPASVAYIIANIRLKIKDNFWIRRKAGRARLANEAKGGNGACPANRTLLALGARRRTKAAPVPARSCAATWVSPQGWP